MNLKNGIHRMQHYCSLKWTRLLIVPALALALGGSLAAYKFASPSSASAAMAAPPAAPLDADSVSPLIALNRAMETLAAHVTPAVVNVTVTSRTKADAMEGQLPEGMRTAVFRPVLWSERRFQWRPRQQPQSRIEHGIGSGVIISPDGYIVTNNHVVDGAVNISVTTNDRHIYPAKLIGADPLTDLAVIKIDGHDLPQHSLGRLHRLAPGQTVLAFGNPYGFRLHRHPRNRQRA